MTKTELLLEVTEGLENMTKLPERPGCFGAALYMNCDADCAFKEDCAKGNKALFEGINLEFENEELEAEIETLLKNAEEEEPKADKKKKGKKAKAEEAPAPEAAPIAEVPTPEEVPAPNQTEEIPAPVVEEVPAPEAAPVVEETPAMIADCAFRVEEPKVEEIPTPEATPIAEEAKAVAAEEEPKKKARKSKVESDEKKPVRKVSGTENILEAHLKCWSVPVAQIVKEVCEQKPVRRIDAYEISRKYKVNKAEVNYMFNKVLLAMEEAGMVKLSLNGKRVVLVWE